MQNVFEGAAFIKAAGAVPHGYSEYDPAPLFKKVFFAEKCVSAKLAVCALGYGYFYINGKRVSDDLFCAPVSDYTKTLWYSEYDVTHLLKEGENTLSAMLGNGFYNESMQTPWGFDKAAWRGVPELICKLAISGGKIIVSDGTWQCRQSSVIRFNQLRCGEIYDAALRKETQNFLCGAGEGEAVEVCAAPAGAVFRKCECPPVREIYSLPPQRIVQTGEKKYLVDFGKNIAGYVDISLCEAAGSVCTIRHAEQAEKDGTLRLNGLNVYQKDYPFQTDRIIADGSEVHYRPMFTYHGFRYAEVDGVSAPPKIRAIAVHNAVRRISSFACSDETLNKLYACAVNSTESNMHYALTDCPTREKLGWLNDAAASAEQTFYNFDMAAFYEKWYRDILDAVREDGCLAGIAPSPGWGYEFGPVCADALYEIARRYFQFTGSDKLLRMGADAFDKNIEYTLRSLTGGGYLGLGDWDGGVEHETPAELIVLCYLVKFMQTAELASRLTGREFRFAARLAEIRRRLQEQYITPNGRCAVETQTAVALMICCKVAPNLLPLQKQLEELFQSKNYHFDCGMVGTTACYAALSESGMDDAVYKIVTAKGVPGFAAWLEDGATGLYEKWTEGGTMSKNHHMYSNFCAWFFNSLAGIVPAAGEVHIRPAFVGGLQFVEAQCRGVRVRWERTGEGIVLEIEAPADAKVFYGKEKIVGKKRFALPR